MNSKIKNFNEESPGWTQFISSVSKEASEKARRRAFDKGYPVLVMKDGRLYNEQPEGTFTLLGENFDKKQPY